MYLRNIKIPKTFFLSNEINQEYSIGRSFKFENWRKVPQMVFICSIVHI